MSDKLANIFDMDPMDSFDNYDVTEEEAAPTEIEVTKLNEVVADEQLDPAIVEAEKDFGRVRDIMQNLLTTSEKVLRTAELVATSSQNNKDIEAYFKGADSITKTAKELLVIHKDLLGIKPPPIPEAPAQTAEVINNNNIIFQGSTGDFITMLKQGLLENKTTPQED